ncbi:MAG: acyl-ACP--UDP-N-acetylglucosamine O-acyltransferase [Opitutus sp.]|nr:acyl-ACP--UDP-N-acetylglucosamine O-acyltransferase [Opitutus sp.]
MATKIHPAAIVEDGAQLGVDCDIRAGAFIGRHCVLEDGVVVHPYAVLGGDPQDLRFDPRVNSAVRIGARTTVREHVTVHRSTREGAATQVGANCFLMATCHVAHDCVVGDNVVIANAALLAGHVHVGANAFLGGGAVFHQGGRVGESAMVGGCSRIALDVPPFVMAAERNEIIGLNLVGLRRRGFPRTTIVELKDAFREVYFTPGNIRTIAADALGSGRYSSEQARRFLEFFTTGKRGIARPRRDAVLEEADVG